MKSERRHELQHNELADWLINIGKALQPYQNAIMTGALIVLALVAGYTLWSRMAANQAAEAWSAVSMALDTGALADLTKVVDDYPNTSAANMAGLVLADSYLAEGCGQLFRNKATALDELNKAIRLYDAIRADSNQPTLVERATFGLARAKESKGDAESMAQAEKLYAEVATNWPQGAYTVMANERLADLKRPTTKAMYDAFAKFDPKPVFSAPADKPEFSEKNVPKEDAAPAKNTPEKKDAKGK